jgi:hypothetical protein
MTLGPTAKARKAKAAKDRRYAANIRKRVAERDGECRIGDWENNPDDTHCDALIGNGCEAVDCGGVSEWAHLGEKKRFKTRGMPPEQRHTTKESCMLCTTHHQMYDAGTLKIKADTEIGADSVLRFWVDDE